MNRLPTALLAGAMAMSTCVLAAEQANQASPATPPKDCSKLSGKDKDKCIQATPAGPVEMQTGAQRKGKSEIAKDRDREKEAKQTTSGAPAQSSDAVGHPHERASTGEAQTGAKTPAKSSAAKAPPAQSKDTVGHPDQRTTTGEAQTGQEAGTKTQ